MPSSSRTLQEQLTTHSADDVLTAAERFFGSRTALYATFLDRSGPGYRTFRGQGGEEVVIAAAPADGGTLVTASTYLFDQQISRFFATLPRVATSTPVPQ